MVDGTIRTCNLQVPITLNLRPHECARGKGRQGKWPKPPTALPLSYIHRTLSAGLTGRKLTMPQPILFRMAAFRPAREIAWDEMVDGTIRTRDLWVTITLNLRPARGRRAAKGNQPKPVHCSAN
jgi:hypothetical protein